MVTSPHYHEPPPQRHRDKPWLCLTVVASAVALPLARCGHLLSRLAVTVILSLSYKKMRLELHKLNAGKEEGRSFFLCGHCFLCQVSSQLPLSEPIWAGPPVAMRKEPCLQPHSLYLWRPAAAPGSCESEAWSPWACG